MGAPLIRSAPFSTVDVLAAYLQVDIDAGDLMANKALQGATDAIQSYVDATISYVENDVVKVDGSGTDVIVLPERPVVDVLEVIEDYDLNVTRDLVLPGNGSESEFDWTPDGLLIRRKSDLLREGQNMGGGWGLRRHSIQVTYSHGYRIDATTVERAQTVSGAALGAHIAVAGFNGATDTLLAVIDTTTAGHPVLTASEDGYGITVTTSTVGKDLLVTWEKSIPSLPVDIEMVCVAAAARAFAQDGATQESAGSYNASYAGQPATLTADEMRVLNRYKPARKR